MSGVSFCSCLGVTWYFSNYPLLLMNEQVVWLHVECYIIKDMIWPKQVKNWCYFRNHVGCQVFLKQHLTFFAFFAFFFFFVDLLPKKDQSKSGKICALLVFEIFNSPFCKQILLWFCRFCPTRWIDDQPVVEWAPSIWKHFTKVIHYWEGLFKSVRPSNKSYETLVKHYRDRLVYWWS